MFRIAKPREFIFKRDCDGPETVEQNGHIFATMAGPSQIDLIDPLARSGPLPMLIVDIINKAKSAGFWTLGTPAHGQSPVSCTVQV